jgi:hypothetical protein
MKPLQSLRLWFCENWNYHYNSLEYSDTALSHANMFLLFRAILKRLKTANIFETLEYSLPTLQSLQINDLALTD